MSVILYHSGNRDRQTQLFENLFGHIHLPLSAVHQDQIRQTVKPCVLVQAAPESSGQNLFHTGIVIGSFDRFYTEFPVIRLFGSALLVNHHGAYALITADVGNIIGFNPLRRFHSQPGSDLSDCADRLCRLPLHPVFILREQYFGVPHGKLHQFFPVSLPRNTDMHPLSLFFRKPVLNHLRLPDFFRKHQVMRNKRGSGIELLDEGLQDFRLVLTFRGLQVKMVPPDQPPVTHKKHLRNGILAIRS